MTNEHLSNKPTANARTSDGCGPNLGRILYFSSQFPNLRSPQMGAFSMQRVLALNQAGYCVRVVSPLLLTPPPQLMRQPRQAYQWVRQQMDLPAQCVREGIPVDAPTWVCPPRQLFGWHSSEYLYWQTRTTLLRVVQEFDPHLILASWLPDAVAAAKFGAQMDIPTLAIADGSDVNVYPEKYRGWPYARQRLNQQAAVILFVSQALRAVALQKGLAGQDSMVLHNAVDVQRFQPGPPRGADAPYTILGVGRLVEGKGFHILMEAFAAFCQSVPQPARLVLVGDGPQRAALKQQAKALGIADCVQVVDPLPQAELVAYYQAADLFCLPSFSEGLPCVVVEAMACGKPVVATCVGGVAEVVDGQSGILLEPGDAKALGAALLQAYHQAWDAGHIRQVIVDGFGWEGWLAKIRPLIDACVTR